MKRRDSNTSVVNEMGGGIQSFQLSSMGPGAGSLDLNVGGNNRGYRTV